MVCVMFALILYGPNRTWKTAVPSLTALIFSLFTATREGKGKEIVEEMKQELGGLDTSTL